MKTTRIMNKIIIYLSAVLLLCSCGSARHYAAFQYDNGDDYVSEGLYRIVDRKGRIGYADETGKTVIRPRFAFGYPFEGGKAKVTDSGERKEVAGSGSEHWYWESDDWYYIDKQGNRCCMSSLSGDGKPVKRRMQPHGAQAGKTKEAAIAVWQ